MRIIIMGPPGSGKGSQAELLQKRLKLKHIPLGELLREEIRKKTRIGKLLEPSLKQGKLAPDDIVDKLITKKIKGRDNFILDGYPRHLAQAKYLDSTTNIDKVFLLKVPDSLVIRRLSSRYVCKCGESYNLLTKKPKRDLLCDKDNKKLYQRYDDKPKIIKKRLKVYKNETKLVLNYYKKRNLLIAIDSSKPIENVFNEIKNKLYKH